MVDVLPELRPRMGRSALQQKVTALQSLLDAEEVDLFASVERYRELEKVKFYLDQDQCELLNRLSPRYRLAVEASTGRWPPLQDFTPDERRSELYVVDD